MSGDGISENEQISKTMLSGGMEVFGHRIYAKLTWYCARHTCSTLSFISGPKGASYHYISWF